MIIVKQDEIKDYLPREAILALLKVAEVHYESNSDFFEEEDMPVFVHHYDVKDLEEKDLLLTKVNYSNIITVTTLDNETKLFELTKIVFADNIDYALDMLNDAKNKNIKYKTVTAKKS